MNKIREDLLLSKEEFDFLIQSYSAYKNVNGGDDLRVLDDDSKDYEDEYKKPQSVFHAHLSNVVRPKFEHYMRTMAFETKMKMVRASPCGKEVRIFNHFIYSVDQNKKLSINVMDFRVNISADTADKVESVFSEKVTTRSVWNMALMGTRVISEIMYGLNNMVRMEYMHWILAHGISEETVWIGNHTGESLRTSYMLHRIAGINYKHVLMHGIKLIAEMLDKEAFALANKSLYEVRLMNYNFCVDHKDGFWFKEIAEKSPALLTKVLLDKSTKHLPEMREALLSEGLTQEGWRWLVKQKHSIGRELFSLSGHLDTYIYQINAIASTNVKHVSRDFLRAFIKRGYWKFFVERKPSQQLQTLMQLFSDLDHTSGSKELGKHVREDLNSRRLLNEICEQAEYVRLKRKGLKKFINNDLSFVMDYLLSVYNDDDDHSFNHLRLSGKFSWQGIMRKQRLWHEEVLNREVESKPYLWDSVITEFTSKNGATFTALNSAKLLVQEGRDMHHCVSSYVTHCIESNNRIFHVTGPKCQRATIQLSYYDDKFSNGQIRGIYNDQVDASLSAAAKEFVNAYNKAWSKLSKTEKETLKQYRLDDSVQTKSTGNEIHADDTTFAIAA